jgi:hypothetical protein
VLLYDANGELAGKRELPKDCTVGNFLKEMGQN